MGEQHVPQGDRATGAPALGLLITAHKEHFFRQILQIAKTKYHTYSKEQNKSVHIFATEGPQKCPFLG